MRKRWIDPRVFVLIVLSIISLTGFDAAAQPAQPTLEEVLVSRAKESIDNGRPLAALQALSEVGADSETPSMRALVRDALFALGDQIKDQPELEGSVSVFKSSDVRGLVARAETQFPELKEKLIKIYTWLLAEAVQQDMTPAAREYYEAVEQRLGPQAPELYEIRLKIALSAQGSAMRQFGHELIDRMDEQHMLSPYVKFRLFMKGYYSGISSLSVIWLGVIAIFLTGLFIRIKTPGPKPQIRIKKRERRGYQTPVEAHDEYSRLLQLFGVDDSISEEDLKARYRELVRQYHPDAAAEAGAAQVDTEKFREIKNAYNRLLEIRKHRFGSR